MDDALKQGAKGGDAGLLREFSEDKKLVQSLQSKLSSLGGSRSAAVKELREVGSRLSSSFTRIKELKAGRDRETAVVRELKAKREEANSALKEISAQLKIAADAEKEATSKLSHVKSSRARRSSPSQLVSDIAALELTIETEVIPFEKEKQLMKIIKEKKKQLESVKLFSEASKSHRELFRKFSSIRMQSNAFHRELQQHAGESQKLHQEMLKIIPHLKELRERRKALLEQLGSSRAEYHAADSSLKEKLHELTSLKEKLDTAAAEKKQAEIERKESQLTEKLKSGKKLTTKDLMTLRD